MFKLLAFLFRYSPKLLTLAIVAAIITGGANTLLIRYINLGIVGFAYADTAYLVRFFGLCLLLPAALIASQLILSFLSQNVIYEMRMNLSRKILKAPLREVEKLGTNKILASITTDVETLSATLMNLPMVCMQSAILLTCLIYLFYLFWPAAVGVMVAIALGVFFYMLFTKQGERYMHLGREKRDTLFKDFEALTYGTKELKLHGDRRGSFIDEVLHTTSDLLRRFSIKGFVYFAVAGSLARFIFFVIIGLYVFYLPDVFEGVTQEVLIGYAVVLIYSLFPLASLTNAVPLFVTAIVSLNKVESLGLTLTTETLEPPVPLAPGATWESVAYRGIAHTYHNEREDSSFVLGPLDLTLEPGELVFLVGGNGSGKTTLAKLLCGLYLPEKGRISIDGEEIVEENRERLRQMFSAVFDDFYLFENMLGMNETGLEARVNDYLKLLQLDHKVTFENNRFSTIQLSQGQRKRLALLTAYMEDRPIYLFDEWAADQDPTFKEVFYFKLLPDLRDRGKAVIAISHDDRYFHVADRLIKMDYGQIEYVKADEATI